jgi:beta-glucosidase
MLPQGADEPYQRLVGWERVELAPGESRTITVSVDTRPLQTFNEANESWSLAPGAYQVMVGPSSDNTPLAASLAIH